MKRPYFPVKFFDETTIFSSMKRPYYVQVDRQVDPHVQVVPLRGLLISFFYNTQTGKSGLQSNQREAWLVNELT